MAEQGEPGGQFSSSPAVVRYLGHFHQTNLCSSLLKTPRRPQRTAVEPKEFQDRDPWSSPWLSTSIGG